MRRSTVVLFTALVLVTACTGETVVQKPARHMPPAQAHAGEAPTRAPQCVPMTADGTVGDNRAIRVKSLDANTLLVRGESSLALFGKDDAVLWSSELDNGTDRGPLIAARAEDGTVVATVDGDLVSFGLDGRPFARSRLAAPSDLIGLRIVATLPRTIVELTRASGGCRVETLELGPVEQVVRDPAWVFEHRLQLDVSQLTLIPGRPGQMFIASEWDAWTCDPACRKLPAVTAPAGKAAPERVRSVGATVDAGKRLIWIGVLARGDDATSAMMDSELSLAAFVFEDGAWKRFRELEGALPGFHSINVASTRRGLPVVCGGVADRSAVCGISKDAGWTTMTSGPADTWVSSVFAWRTLWLARGQDTVWVANADGLARLRGQSWQPLPHPPWGDIVALAAGGPEDLWVVNDHGWIHHARGGQWRPIRSPVGALNAIDVVSPSEVWVAGDAGGARWDGQRWHVFTERLPAFVDIASDGMRTWFVQRHATPFPPSSRVSQVIDVWSLEGGRGPGTE